MQSVGSVIVSWDFSNGQDSDILLVGKKDPKKPVEIIKAFQGEEARELYKKLVTRKG